MMWIIYIFLDAIVNWYWIEHKSKSPNYMQLTIFRGWAAILICIYYQVDAAIGVWYFLFCACSFWILFDIMLNTFRGENIFYIGTNSKIDKFGQNNPELYFTAKIIALIVAIISINKVWI